MPFTFLSHQAVVLPLKLAAPRRISGTAIVLGSMAPDAEYVMRTYATGTFAHSWLGQIAFCLPLTLAMYWLVTRIVAPAAGANLPEVPPFRLRDYALAGAGPLRFTDWVVVALCGLAGSTSHVLLDRGERALERFLAGAMGITGDTFAIYGSPTTALVQVGGSLALAVVSLALLARIGDRRLVRVAAMERGIDGAAVDRARWKPALYWWLVAIIAVGSGVTGFVTRSPGFFATDVATWAHVWLASVAGATVGLVGVSALWMMRSGDAIVDSGDPARRLRPSPNQDR